MKRYRDILLLILFIGFFHSINAQDWPDLNRFRKQNGKGSFNKRRNPEDSEININKSIIEQFNLFRISDNNNYPVFLDIKGINTYLKYLKNIKK